jgi:hypothetical protein
MIFLPSHDHSWGVGALTIKDLLKKVDSLQDSAPLSKEVF